MYHNLFLVYNIPMFSPAYLRDRGPHPFSADLSLKWDWGGAKIFDVDTSSTQNNAFPYAFNFGWGEHCIHMTLCDSVAVCW